MQQLIRTILVAVVTVLLLVGCGEDSQPPVDIDATVEARVGQGLTPVPTPTATATQVPPTATWTPESRPTAMPTQVLPAATWTPEPRPTATPTQVPPTATPTPMPTPTIVGVVRFRVDIPQVTTVAQLEQASIVGPSLIRLKDGRYRLYLQARADRRNESVDGTNIISLISTDGIQWDVEPGIRIPHGNESDVDSEAGEPGVYLGLDDKYHMAYTGRFMGINRMGKSQKMHRVVFAVSNDGLAWTKQDQHYADPENINDFASSADVTIVNGEHVIYYTGQRNIIRATYDGLTWVRQEVAFSAGHDSTMVKIDDAYYMFWMMSQALEYTRNSDTKEDLLFMAVSRDGVNWSKDYYRVVVENSDGSGIDARNIQDPGAIVLSDGTPRIFLNDEGGKSIYSIKPVATLPKLDTEASAATTGA